MKSINQHRRGFAIGPVLYALAIAGILGGTLFSNNMQLLRSNLAVQNGMTAKNDLQATANVLAAEAVLSADTTLLCPPRSVHETTGKPCDTAPVALVQFGDLSASVAARLPANYANAASSGSPVEVGAFAAGAGVRMVDPYGHLYIYCRWENPRSNPVAPAFALLSAGADGILQTTCGDSAPQGDDYLYVLSVGEAINHAALWQSDTSNGVSYGATGSKVTIDSDGNISAVNVSASNNITITNNLTANSITAPNATVSNTLTANTISASGVNVAGTANVVTLDAANAVVSGAVAANTIAASGTVSGSTGSFTTVNASNAAITNGITAATVATTGDITAKDVTVSNTVSGATGSFTALGASGLTVSGAATVGSLSSSGAVTGISGSFTTLNTVNETVSGTLTANNFSISGTGSAATGFFTNLTASNATITNTLIANALTASSATVSGTVSGGTGTFTTLNANNLTATNNITASGTVTASTGNFTNLTAGNLTATNNQTIGGTITVQGAATFNNNMNVSGSLWISNSPFILWTDANGGNGSEILETSPWSGGAIINFGTTEWSGYYDFFVGSNLGNGNVAEFGCNPCGNWSVTPGGYLKLFGSAASVAAMPTTVDIETSGASYINGGNLGIGTATPAATLDVNGYMRLKKNTSAPATCNTGQDGALALTHIYTLCVCKSGTGWVTASTGTTSCTF